MKATFKQRDVKAAIRAVEAAGKVVQSVEIDPTGALRIIVQTDHAWYPGEPEKWELK